MTYNRLKLEKTVLSAIFLFTVSGINSRGSAENSGPIGTVTVSTPIFVPIEDSVQGDKRLSFKDLRSETSLATTIQKPSSSLALIQQRLLSAGVSGGFVQELPTTSSQALDPLKQAINIQSNSANLNERLIPKPDEIARTIDQARLSLSPDDLATLIAGYKTYMVNLEEFINVDGLGYDQESVSDYVPYKMHFQVTVEPGWQTRIDPYDAVVELELSSDEDAREYRIVSFAPVETAQVLTELNAAFDELALALSIKGLLGNAGAEITSDYVKRSIKKIETIRLNKQLIAAFPEQNRLRIRFRPSFRASEEPQDLQPLTRVLSAVVLVKNYGRKLIDGNTQRTVLSPLTSAYGATGEQQSEPHLFSPANCIVRVSRRFEPGLVENQSGKKLPSRSTRRAGTLSPPNTPTSQDEDIRIAIVPRWFGPLRRSSLQLVRADGVYSIKPSFDPKQLQAIQSSLASVNDYVLKVVSLNANTNFVYEVAKSLNGVADALSKSKSNIMQMRSTNDAARMILTEQLERSDLTNQLVKAELERVKQRLIDLSGVYSDASKSVNDAGVELSQATNKNLIEMLDERKRIAEVIHSLIGGLSDTRLAVQALTALPTQSLTNSQADVIRTVYGGSAVVSLNVDAPDYQLDSTGKAKGAYVYARIVDATGNAGQFEKLGRGRVSTALQIANLELGVPGPVWDSGIRTGQLPSVSVILQVALSLADSTNKFVISDAVQTITTNITLIPKFGVSTGAK